MFQIVKQSILFGVLLVACAFVCSGDEVPAETKDAAKSLYSNRSAGHAVPAPHYGTPTAPQFMLPTVPEESPRVAVSPAITGTTPTTPTTPKAPSPAPSVPVQTPPSPIIEKTTVVVRDKQEVSIDDEVDQIYARLAKIQLEKHQLPAALAYVQKMKSKVFKVKSVMDLAEYVSRDKNYLAEFDQLCQMTLKGVDALLKNEPFNIEVSAIPTVPEIKPEATKPEATKPKEPELLPDDLTQVPLPVRPMPGPEVMLDRNGNPIIGTTPAPNPSSPETAPSARTPDEAFPPKPPVQLEDSISPTTPSPLEPEIKEPAPKIVLPPDDNR